MVMLAEDSETSYGVKQFLVGAKHGFREALAWPNVTKTSMQTPNPSATCSGGGTGHSAVLVEESLLKDPAWYIQHYRTLEDLGIYCVRYALAPFISRKAERNGDALRTIRFVEHLIKVIGENRSRILKELRYSYFIKQGYKASKIDI